MRRRLAVYDEQTELLEAFYRERGLLHEIDAEAREDDVTQRMIAELEDVE